MLNFCNQFDQYCPHTFKQFEQFLNGREDDVYRMDNTNKEKFYVAVHNRKTDDLDLLKQECRSELKWRVILLPFDVVGRTVFNVLCTVKKIIQLVLETFKLPFNFVEGKKQWVATFLEVADYALASLLSPIQPCLKIYLLIIGCKRPQAIYLPKDKWIDRRQKEVDLKFVKMDVKNQFKHLKNMMQQSSTEIEPNFRKDVIILDALFNYACRWGLFEPHTFGRKAANFAKLDRVDIRLEFANAFVSLMSKWIDRQKSEENDIATFCTNIFKTPYQQKILNQFVVKDFNKIPFSLSDYAPNVIQEYLWKKSGEKITQPIWFRSNELNYEYLGAYFKHVLQTI